MIARIEISLLQPTPNLRVVIIYLIGEYSGRRGRGSDSVACCIVAHGRTVDTKRDRVNASRSAGADTRARYACRMPRRFTFAAVVLSLAAVGCAGTWQRVYASARTSAEFIDATHERGWSEPLLVRVDECGESLPEHANPDMVDVCLGPFAANAEVLTALEAYNAAADVLAATLLAADPRGDQAQVLAAWADVLAAARAFVALLPDGARYLKQLDALTRGTRRPS